MKKLYRSFRKIDKNKSGDLDIEEFMSLPELA